MGRQQQDELRRLEEALMEDLGLEDIDFFSDKQMTQKWQPVSVSDYGQGNTDQTDVDLQAYSEEVYRGRSRTGWGVCATMLSMAALSACHLEILSK